VKQLQSQNSIPVFLETHSVELSVVIYGGNTHRPGQQNSRVSSWKNNSTARNTQNNNGLVLLHLCSPTTAGL